MNGGGREVQQSVIESELSSVEGQTAHSPNVHEPKSSDVGRVGVVQQALQLFAGQFEREELVQEAIGGGDYPTCRHTSDLRGLRLGNFTGWPTAFTRSAVILLNLMNELCG